MIQRLSHSTIFVNDQDKAKQFYTEKLGFEVRMDVVMGNFRWLTVAPKGDPIEMVLMPMQAGPMMDEANTQKLRDLVSQGKLGPGVFSTSDCRKTFMQLKEKGVQFPVEPTERPYGIEAVFADDSGNQFSLVQAPAK
jgi:predicted enzyme related to lactoylglutathione lyase